MKLLLPLFLLAAIGFVSTATAKIVYIDSTPIGNSNARNGTSWEKAFTLFDRDVANAIVPGDEVWIAGGFYGVAELEGFKTHFIFADVDVYGGFAGGELLLEDRPEPSEANRTFLRGLPRSTLADNPRYSPTVLILGDGTLLDRIEVEFARNDVPDEQVRGGAVSISGQVTLIDCRISGNENVIAREPPFFPGGFGGGIRITDSDANVIFINCDINANRARYGGGAYITNGATALFRGCHFGNNIAERGDTAAGTLGGLGGALYISDEANVTVDDCVFDGNISHSGGSAIHVQNASLNVLHARFLEQRSGGGVVHLDSSFGGFVDCEFDDNWIISIIGAEASTVAVEGGSAFTGNEDTCVSLRQGSSATIRDTRFEGNNDGAITGSSDASLSVVNCEFSNNASEHNGGAIDWIGSDLELVNCAFYGNSAETHGGALYQDISSGGSGADPLATVINCSFGYNSAGVFGGGIYNGSEMDLKNTILWDNEEGDSTITSGENIWNFAAESVTEFDFCLVGGRTSQALDATGSGSANNLEGYDASDSPDFRGPDDLRLGRNSPALDAGANSANSESFDADGETRVQNGSINLGAYESQPRRIHVKRDATGAGDGTSWADAYTSLWTGLQNAEHSDDIWVAAGSYSPALATLQDLSFDLVNGVRLYGGFIGTEIGLFQRLSGFETVLSGDVNSDGDTSNDTYQVVTAVGVGDGALLDGFTIERGRARELFGPDSGGGLYLEDSSLIVRNCVFRENNSSFAGGAVHVLRGAPLFDACVFANNTSSSGGAVYDDLSSATYANCEFRGNQATILGGALYLHDSSSVEVTNCSVAFNEGVLGGGGFYFDSSPIVSRVYVRNTLVWNNESNVDSAGDSFDVTGRHFPNFDDCLVESWPAIFLRESDATRNYDGHLPENDPRFAGSQDLRLRPGSPAIDAGDDQWVIGNYDVEGKTRIQGAAVNLGASEHQTLRHYVDATATGSDDGTSWNNAWIDLPPALAAANRGDEVWVATGTYKPTDGNDRSVSFQLHDGVALHGHFAGTEASLQERNLADGNHRTVLSGNIGAAGNVADNSYHVVRVDGVSDSAILEGFSIRFGRATGTVPDDEGGGLFCENVASPQVLRCEFRGNQAVYGGAIFCRDESNPLVSDCTFSGNSVSRYGGAVHTLNASPTFVNCTMAGNSALERGGAIYNDGSEAHFVNCIVWLNTVGAGGIESLQNTVNSDPTVDHSLFEGMSLELFGSGNISGIPFSNRPRFVRVPDSGDGNWQTLADNDYGDLKLEEDSPAIDAGDNSANGESIDLDGLARMEGLVIDLGAYEGVTPEPSFAMLFTSLDPNADADGNGRSNFLDYALGENPLEARSWEGRPLADAGALLFRHRAGAADAIPVYEISNNLSRWRTMVEGLDYNVTSTQTSGGVTRVILKISPRDGVFYRQRFEQ